VTAQIAKALSIVMEPFLPSASKDLRTQLNLPERIAWKDAISLIPPGHKVSEARPLFKKIEAPDDEIQGMLEEVRSTQETISFDDFSRMDLRVGRIVKVEPIPKSGNLLKLTIDIGDNEPRTVVAGIATHYKPQDLEGTLVSVIVNLAPRKVGGVTSEVMVLAAQDRGTLALIQPSKPVEAGSRIS